MHWALQDNLAEILQLLGSAAQAGASLCLLPELALSGFHRRMTESLDAATLAAVEVRLGEACARFGIAAIVGLPTRGAAGEVFNSQLYLDARGLVLGRIHKRGLTPSEATVFAAGGPRGWIEIDGVLATSVLCRETLDAEALLPELAAGVAGSIRPRVICWPSFIASSDAEQAALTAAYLAGAQGLARALGAWVLQSNWPESLNQPLARGFGRSAVIAPDGRLLRQLTADAPELALVELTARS